MKKAIRREYRSRPLSPAEAARDEEIRRKVQDEFPPADSSQETLPDSLSQALKQAIRASDKTEYQIAQEAGVSQIVISRFLSGERDIRLATADKLAGALNLKFSAAL